MKVIRRFFTGVGVLAVLAAIVVGLLMAFSGPEGSDGKTSGIDAAGMMTREAVDKVRDAGARAGKRLAWLTIAFSALMQGSAWAAAASRLRWLRRLKVAADEKLQQLEAIDVYFDLPLYFGLLGSVLSFILITIYPDAGLMFAYASTAMGIMVSVILRIGYFTPLKQSLIRERIAEAEHREDDLADALAPFVPPETVRHRLDESGGKKGNLRGVNVGQILK